MRFCTVLALSLSLGISSATAQEGPSPEVRALIDAVVQTTQASDDESIGLFIVRHVDPDYVAEVGNSQLHALIRELRSAAAGTSDLGVDRTPDGLTVIFRGGPNVTRLSMGVSFDGPLLVHSLGLDVQDAGTPGQVVQPRTLDEAYEIRSRGLEDVTIGGDEAIEAFLENHAAAEADGLREALRNAQRIGAAAGGIMVSVSPGVVTVGFRGPESADFALALEESPPFRVTAITVGEAAGGEEGPEPYPFSWSSLSSQLDDAEAEGYSGSVIAVRGGEVVLQRGLGLADRSTGRTVNTETQFDIGSMPIDFTRAAALLLMQRGQLDRDASLTEYLEHVPDDKDGITIGHLMTGASGLPNYHHLPEDADADLTFISRDQAVTRILGRPLLFVPGQGESHSHSAWGLLAAIVEIVSGEEYGAFLDRYFFEPAEMTRTTFYGPDDRFVETDQAVGYGHDSVGSPNIPLNWGPVSWLVKGAGGMVSTPGDLYRWHRFIRVDGPLTNRSKEYLPSTGTSMGDSDRGFLTVSSFSEDSIVIACTNVMGPRDDLAESVARGLARLTR